MMGDCNSVPVGTDANGNWIFSTCTCRSCRPPDPEPKPDGAATMEGDR